MRRTRSIRQWFIILENIVFIDFPKKNKTFVSPRLYHQQLILRRFFRHHSPRTEHLAKSSAANLHLPHRVSSFSIPTVIDYVHDISRSNDEANLHFATSTKISM